MARYVSVAVVFVFAFLILGHGTRAEAASFDTNLSLNGVQGSAHVIALQEFLKGQGVYSGDVTGYFGPMTYAAVVRFQTKEGIFPPSGYFGPVTRERASALAVGTGGVVAGASTISDSVRAAIEAQIRSLMAQIQSLTTKLASRGTVASSNTRSSSGGGGGGGGSSSEDDDSNSGGGGGGGGGSSNPDPEPEPEPETGPEPEPEPEPEPSSDLEWGSYTGDSLATFTAFETLVGKQGDIQAIFWSFNHPFPTAFNSLGEGKALLIFWEPDFDYDVLNSGAKDAYIAEFARGAAEYAEDHRLIMVPFNEPNLGDEEEIWGDTGDNTPAEFVAGWRRVHDIFEQEGAGDVEFGIAYNNFSTGPNPDFDDYYPGDAYVDHVGVDGFNWSDPGRTPQQVLGPALTKLQDYGKPLYIYSVATPAGSGKAAWIRAFGDYVESVPGLEGWVWFNIDKEENWLIDSDQASLAAFRSIVP